MGSKSGARGNASWAMVVVALLAVIAAASVVLGAQGIIAFAESNEPPPAPAVLTTTLRAGTVEQQVAGEVTVQPEYEWLIELPQSEGLEPIVTRPGLGIGEEAGVGVAVAVVAERPVFVLPGSLPAYRPLGPGSGGTDVVQLQEALLSLGYSIWDESGTYGASTATAVYNFYTAKHFQPVTAEGESLTLPTAHTAGIPFGEARFLPALPATATDSCGQQGEQAEELLCTLTGGTLTLILEVPATEAGALESDQMVEVTTSDGTEITGVLGARREAPLPGAEDTNSSSSTLDSEATSEAVAPPATVSYVVNVPDETALTVGQTGTAVITTASSSTESLMVEGTAIRTDPDGSTWLATTPQGTRLSINVGLCATGFCAVEGENAVEGMEIELPSPNADVEQ